MDLDLNQYIDVFVEEAKEHLQGMNESLLELEKDISNTSIINELFRVAHTLKGMSGTMGFNNMANLTHEMESVLEGVRSNNILLNENVIDIIFECFDALDYSVNLIATTGEENNDKHTELISKLQNVLEYNVDKPNNKTSQDSTNLEMDKYVLNVIAEAKKKGLLTYEINIKLSPQCMLKSARAFIIFNTLETLGDIIYSNPPAEDIEDEKFDLDFSITFVSKVSKAELEGELNNISEIEKVEVNLVAEDELDNVKKHNTDNDLERTTGSTALTSAKPKKNNVINKDRKIGKTVRVDIDRLDNLMNLVSELIIIKTRMDDLSETSNRENMIEAIEYLERITTSLHDAVMKVRMVPIERVFNRFPRMVRDLSKELNKEVVLEMSGEETEVDRTVIDEIGDPLIHIIRNSIDHGIETPEERIKQGKSKEGTIVLKSYPDGNNVVIEIIDDGKGMDPEIIKQKAIEKDLVTPQEIEVFSEEEIINLLFMPGFSTSEKVSDVSGRGVGLDVVKSKIEAINGSVEIDSQINVGTDFIIRIPLTLAIIQALLINLGEEIYAVPLSSITEITSIEENYIRNIQGQEIILYRGKTIPIVRLNKLLDIKSSENMEEQIVIVVKKGEKEAGLLVDNLIGQQEIVIKPLGKYLSNIKYLSGATILGNGNISLILDVNSII